MLMRNALENMVELAYLYEYHRVLCDHEWHEAPE